jgi:hypothetical protein
MKETAVTFWDSPRREKFFEELHNAILKLLLVVLAHVAWDILHE